MSEPTPRQVLYALVAAGFVVVVAVLVAGGAASGIAPGWWTAVMGVAVGVVASWLIVRWRRTGPALVMSIGLFVIWLAGTLIISR